MAYTVGGFAFHDNSILVIKYSFSQQQMVSINQMREKPGGFYFLESGVDA
jgi:hypothetical protein